MAFTFLHLRDDKPDHTTHLLPLVICDHCHKSAGPDGWALFGGPMEDSPAVTSTASLVATIRAACSPMCRDAELASASGEDEAVVGYAPLHAYIQSLTQDGGPIRVTHVSNAARPSGQSTEPGRETNPTD
jgi:hypothetical protein